MLTHRRLAPHPSWLPWIGLSTTLSLVLLVVVPAAAQNQTAAVRVDPALVEISPGQVATVTVMLTRAQNVYGIDVRATFDPKLVEVVDEDPAKEGTQFTPGTFPRPDFLVRNVADNQAGTLQYAITQVNPTEPANGDGVLFTVQLRAKADSGESPFTIGPVEMADRTGSVLPVLPESGNIRIVPVGSNQSSQPATTVSIAGSPTPTAVAASAENVQLIEKPLPQATIASTSAVSQAAMPESANKAGSTMPILVVLALVAIIALVIVIIARRRAVK